jgi:hypothetical protein
MQDGFFDRMKPETLTEAAAGRVREPVSSAELTRMFNAAILSTRADRKRDFAAELYQIVESPAFASILSAIRDLSRTSGVSERQAAEAMVSTFRKLDAVWTDYAFQEGVDRLSNPSGPS